MLYISWMHEHCHYLLETVIIYNKPVLTVKVYIAFLAGYGHPYTFC